MMFNTSFPLLDARLWGTEIFSAAAGESTHYITFPFDCKFSGVDFIAESSTFGDTVSIQTEYNAGVYGWKRYKKFGKNWHVKANERDRILLFPTEPKQGIRVKITYNNVGESTVRFTLNMFTFAEQEKINPLILQEGADW